MILAFMGCNTSKVDNLPLVSVCRERKDLIRAAADHRYALAAAHSAYFQSLRHIGDAIHRFVTNELSSVVPSSPPSSPPAVTLKNKPSPPQLPSSSHNSPTDQDSHLHFDSDSGDGDGDGSCLGGSHRSSAATSPPKQRYYYMKSSAAIPTTVYQLRQDLYPSPSHSIGEAPIGSSPRDAQFGDRKQSPAQPPSPQPPPPPPPEVSAWDFMNPFNSFENFYPSYSYPIGRYSAGSIASSPDWAQVREREGIPDLEEETEGQGPVEEVEKKVRVRNSGRGSGEGTSKPAPLPNEGDIYFLQKKGTKSSRGGSRSKSRRNAANSRIMRKKGVRFGADITVANSIESSPLSSPPSLNSNRISNNRNAEKIESWLSSNLNSISTHRNAVRIESSQASNLNAMSAHGNGESIASSRPSEVSTHRARNIQEVLREIKEQFETASEYGKEVAGLLEVGKLQYQPKNSTSEVLSCRVLDAIDPPKLTASRSSSRHLQHTYTPAKGRDRVPSMKSGSLSLTLEKLYAWEKKLYKEVKDEEKLRISYEKKCKQLRFLDDGDDATDKIDATQATIRKLLTKINIAIKTIDAISSRIHKLRDEELQPQLNELIQGLIRMWKNMVKCHQKQFQAILETKSHSFIEKPGIRRDSCMQAAQELEQELMKWYSHFNDWVNTQKAYVEALNGWLLKFLLKQPEETPDGMVPFSPGRVGAPPVFIICNDWYHAMERISGYEVLRAMQDFSARVHMLWELQDEERRQKLKAEFLSKDLEMRLRSLHQEQGKGNAMYKKAMLVPNKDSIVLHDDLDTTLDSMKKRLDEERDKHKETMKHVQEAAAGSLEMGLIPIFEAMDNFTSETLKAHEEVRIQTPRGTY